MGIFLAIKLYVANVSNLFALQHNAATISASHLKTGRKKCQPPEKTMLFSLMKFYNIFIFIGFY